MRRFGRGLRGSFSGSAASAEQSEQGEEALEHDLTNGSAPASFRGMAQAHYYGGETLTESERELFELADTQPCPPNPEAASFEAFLQELADAPAEQAFRLPWGFRA